MAEYDAEEFAAREAQAQARQQQQQQDWARFDKQKVVKEWLREQEAKGVVPVVKLESHRCNRRLEDVVKGAWASPMNVSQPFKNFWRCVRSQEGQEPTEPFCNMETPPELVQNRDDDDLGDKGEEFA